jgi:protein gp37
VELAMGRTSIEWADFSVNPIRARDRVTGKVGHWCEKVSAGCAHCYSSALQEFRFHGHPFEARFRDKVEVYFESRALDEVRRRRIPTRWFWCDMTDLFGPWVRHDWLGEIIGTMGATPHHTHIALTKRPERMRDFLTRNARPGGQLTTPLPNVWWGTSVEDQATADARITLLLQTPAAVRWVSYEPALGPVEFDRWLARACQECDRTFTPAAIRAEEGWGHPCSVRRGVTRCESYRHPALDWLVVGGESGPGARPFDLAWARSAIAQCRAAGVACFIKQLGARPRINPLDRWEYEAPVRDHAIYRVRGGDYCLDLRDRKGGDMAEWPEDLRIREWPAGAGRGQRASVVS